MTNSMHEASVGVFVPFLKNLSALLDQAARYADQRKIDSAVLLNARLYPNMYSLARQVGEANRHAVVGCALLAGCEPLASADNEPDLPELKSRIAATAGFIEGLPRAAIEEAADRPVVSPFATGRSEALPGGRCC